MFDIANYNSRKLHKNMKPYDDDLLSQCTSGTATTMLTSCNHQSHNSTIDKTPIISDYLIICSDDSESTSSIQNECLHLLHTNN